MDLTVYEVPFIVLSVFIALDVATGVTAGAATKSLNSTKAREGLFHKVAFYFAFALAVALEIATQYISVGIQVPAVGAVVTYIVVTEVFSILENICIINPALKDQKFLDLFNKSDE